MICTDLTTGHTSYRVGLVTQSEIHQIDEISRPSSVRAKQNYLSTN